MDSMLDSLTWVDELSQSGKKRSRRSWWRKAFVVLTALFALGVLLS
jgi:hypothetical protein